MFLAINFAPDQALFELAVSVERFSAVRSRLRKFIIAGVAVLFAIGTAHAQLQIVNDDGGANDPNGDGQNDLTQFGRDDSDPNFFLIKWSWDEPSTIQGGNASNACGLFDTDGDGDNNFSFCLEVSFGDQDGDGVEEYFITDSGDGTDSVADFPAWIECADSKDDRCAQPDRLADPYNGDLMGSSCTIMVSDTDPFETDPGGQGDDFPKDLMATCQISKMLIPDGAEFINVCSYPSAGNDGNSNPFDCVVTPGSGFIEIAKVVTDPGLEGTEFTFTIEPSDSVRGEATQFITGNGSTDLIAVAPGDHFTISESTDPLYITDSIVCEPPAGSDNGSNISGVTVSPGATTTCTFTNSLAFIEAPAIAIDKTPDTQSIEPGADAVFTLSVTVGTGNIALNNVNVVDSQCDSAPVFEDGDTNSDGFLDLDEIWNYTCAVSSVTEGFTNTATATGVSPGGASVEATDSAIVTVLAASLAIDKPAPVNADEDGSEDVSAGDTLTYTITATNDGDANLTNVVVSDGLITATGGTTPCASLAPGATCTLIGTYVVTSADVTAGEVFNEATADSDQTDPVTDTETVVVPAPILSLVKSGVFNDENGDTFANAGSETITYSFDVGSTGTANLTNVLVSDPLAGLSEISCQGGNPIAFLAAGAQVSCTATYTIIQGDVDAGVRENTATADSTQTGSVDSSASVDLPQNPDAVVAKSADFAEVDAAGDVINYTVTVANTGNVTLDPVALQDKINGTVDVTLTYDSGDTGSTAGRIDVGEVWSYTGSYVVTQPDMDSGLPLTNVVCIADVDGNGIQDADECADVSTTVLQLPGHDFQKQFTADSVEIGSDGSFTLTYTNTGNVTLSDVLIEDQVAPILSINSVGILDTGSCAGPATQAVACSVDSLAPGESVEVTVGFTAAEQLDQTNQTSGASYVFYFENGYVLSGSTATGEATLLDPVGNVVPAGVEGANQDIIFNTPDGQSFGMHLSCSEPFIGGFGLTGPTEAENSEWKISSYSVDRYNSQGFLKSCRQTFGPLLIDNTASAEATAAGGTLTPNPIDASDSVELIQISPIEVTRQRVRRGNVEIQYFNTSREAIEIAIIGVTWDDGAELQGASYRGGVDLGLLGTSPQSADINTVMPARSKDWLRLDFIPKGAPDGLTVTIVLTDGSTLSYEF